MRRRIATFASDERGAVTIDFVLVFLPQMLFVLMIVEILLAFHFTSQAQKAAQMAARLAAVMPPIHSGVPQINLLNTSGGEAGQYCYQPSGTQPCINPTPVVGAPVTEQWVCKLGSTPLPKCSEEGFREILAKVDALYPNIHQSQMEVRYDYLQLGVACGPFVPLVTVTITARSSPVRMLSPLGLLELRPVQASVLGENMRFTGPSPACV